MPAKPTPRKHHLAKAKTRSKRREVADGDDTDQDEEQASQNRVHESKVEQLLAEKADSERRDDHVGGEPL